MHDDNSSQLELRRLCATIVFVSSLDDRTVSPVPTHRPAHRHCLQPQQPRPRHLKRLPRPPRRSRLHHGHQKTKQVHRCSDSLHTRHPHRASSSIAETGRQDQVQRRRSCTELGYLVHSQSIFGIVIPPLDLEQLQHLQDASTHPSDRSIVNVLPAPLSPTTTTTTSTTVIVATTFDPRPEHRLDCKYTCSTPLGLFLERRTLILPQPHPQSSCACPPLADSSASTPILPSRRRLLLRHCVLHAAFCSCPRPQSPARPLRVPVHHPQGRLGQTLRRWRLLSSLPGLVTDHEPALHLDQGHRRTHAHAPGPASHPRPGPVHRTLQTLWQHLRPRHRTHQPRKQL